MQGEVKFYNVGRQFGYVAITDGDLIHAEYFFHGTAVVGAPPYKGCEVEFELDDDNRGSRGGLIATAVKRLGYELAPLARLGRTIKEVQGV
jgi:cold shock CspA family protein